LKEEVINQLLISLLKIYGLMFKDMSKHRVEKNGLTK